MRLIQTLLMVLIGAFVLAATPVLAHGDNKHETSVAASKASNEASETVAPQTVATETSGAADHAQQRTRLDEVVQTFKSLHPATVHFPIALFLMAALTELFLIIRPAADLAGPVRVMVYGGAAGAIVAALFGWIHTGLWFGGDGAMQIHRWTGTGIAAAGILAAIAVNRATSSRAIFRTVLFSIGAALLVQGYLGGELAHGPRHLGF